jgi:hypothetical protein
VPRIPYRLCQSADQFPIFNINDITGIDDVRAPLDIYNRRLEKGLSGFDVPNQFRLSFVYSLPFGRDRQFGGSLDRVVNVVNAIVGGSIRACSRLPRRSS